MTTIETGYGYRSSSEYFFLTPDWRTVFVSRQKGKPTRVENDGKKLTRWEFDGEVRAWDLATGRRRETFQHTPPRNITWMQLARDGRTFVTQEQLPGEWEGSPPSATSLWDVKAGTSRPLPGKLSVSGPFSPDSKTIAAVAPDGDDYTTAVKLFDVATGEERLSIPVGEKFTWIDGTVFTPDGRLLVGWVQTFPGRKNWQSWRSGLKFWDAASGKEVAWYPLDEKNSGFTYRAFSPDGRTLATTNWKGEQCKLFLFDLPGKRLARAVVLGEKTFARDPAFSPDGKWVAVMTQVALENGREDDELTAEDLPQPRVHLIEAATGIVRETLVAPPGPAGPACFSPDGKTLATAGSGRVLLWDLANPPLGQGRPSN